MLITEDYRRVSEEMHQLNENFGNGAAGRRWYQTVIDLARNLETRDVLDYGCGKGLMRRSIPLLDIKNYDPAIKEWSALPEPADIVVCLDVMEHIEPDCLGDVLRHLASCVKKGLIISAATRPAMKVLPDGRNAHLIVEPYIWWLNRFEEMGLSMAQAYNTENNELLCVYKRDDQEVDTENRSLNL